MMKPPCHRIWTLGQLLDATVRIRRPGLKGKHTSFTRRITGTRGEIRRSRVAKGTVWEGGALPFIVAGPGVKAGRARSCARDRDGFASDVCRIGRSS